MKEIKSCDGDYASGFYKEWTYRGYIFVGNGETKITTIINI